jgi:alginate O-acetyltransferase complex protein AlgI
MHSSRLRAAFLWKNLEFCDPVTTVRLHYRSHIENPLPSTSSVAAMNLLSLTYALFLLGTLGIYWSVSGTHLKMWVLVVASLLFYGSLQPQYIPLLLVLTWITFQLGRAIGAPPDWRIEDWQFAQQDWNRRRLRLLMLGIFIQLFLLFSFKSIALLFLSGLAALFHLNLAPTEAALKTVSALTPVGLSFFTFECIAYLVDVYRGAPASRSFPRFASYKLFFPKTISGPITRYPQFITQLQSVTFPRAEQFTEGLWLIACGAVKKGIVADHLGTFTELTFANIPRVGSGDLWLALIAYGFQIYLDFSGYVDVARGSAMLLGIHLPQNFDFPYFSTNIADFWRRWHMTLGDWLRNYLYFPLGGSRRGLVRTCVNLMIVMLVCGVWHGATWGFVLWGAVHGVGLVVHRLVADWSDRSSALTAFWSSVPGILVAWFCTQLLVMLSWIPFRVPQLKEVGLLFQSLWGKTADPQFISKVYGDTLKLTPQQFSMALLLLFGLMAIAYLFHRGLKIQINWYLKLLLVPICLYGVYLLAPQGVTRYIYFDF